MVSYKKQHYVPQFYLRNFDANVKKNPSIYCFNVLNCNSFINNINKVAQKSYFYTSENDKNNMENKLSNIENELNKHIKLLVKNKNHKYLNNLQVRADLSYYMSIQFVRTAEKREFFKNQINEFEKFIYQDDEIDNEYLRILQEFSSKDNIKHEHLKMIDELSIDFIKYFYYKKWVLIKNKTKISFWTSDNPVVVFNPFYPEGIGQKHSHIFFPLSPKVCICLCDPNYYTNFLEIKKKDFDVYSNMLKSNYYKLSDNECAKSINKLQVKFCTHQVFSKFDDFNIFDEEYWNKVKVLKQKPRTTIETLPFKSDDGNEIIRWSNYEGYEF